MINNMKRYINWLLLVCTILTCSTALISCNDEDDIDAIFTGKTWYLGNFYTTNNWKDENSRNPYFSAEEKESAVQIINAEGKDRFFIQFANHTFTAKGLRNTFSGTWDVDGKKNTLTFIITDGSVPPQSGVLADRISRLFYEGVQETSFYIGSTIYLKLFPTAKTTYLQFGKNRKEK